MEQGMHHLNQGIPVQPESKFKSRAGFEGFPAFTQRKGLRIA
jgi:hypothetical protein